MIIRGKTLELISRHIGDLDSGYNLVEFLKGCGVPREFIEYPNTKWRMVYNVLVRLSSSNKESDHKLLFRIIEEAIHPLMYQGSKEFAKQAQEKFNRYLEYDGFQLYDFKLHKKGITPASNGKVEGAITINQNYLEMVILELYKEAVKAQETNKDYTGEITLGYADDEEINEKGNVLEYLKTENTILDYQLNLGEETFLFRDYNTMKPQDPAEEITIDVEVAKCKFYPSKIITYAKRLFEPKKIYCEELANLYLKMINIVEAYFKEPIIRDEKLNKFYTQISEKIKDLLNQDLIPSLKLFDWLPFANLFLAQEEMEKKNTNLQKIINSMNAFYGRLHKFIALYEIKEKRGDEIEELDKYLGSLQAQKKKQEAESTSSKIEIIGMPELKIKGLEERVILQKPKNKRIQLRRFPKDLKWEEITIRFLNEHEVIIKARNDTFQIDYDALGFQDEKKKLPNKQWQFLRLLAFKNGEISWENNRDLSLQQINSIKKQKQLLTEALKAYFQIYDDEPFYDYKKEKAYKIKLNLIPEGNTKTAPNEQEILKEDDELGIKETYKEQTPEIYEE